MSFNRESEYAVIAKSIGKKYRLNKNQYDKNIFMALTRQRVATTREYWAVRDISFQVRKGETLGLIGKNGAGKSTVLQIVCGTINPTEEK